MFRIPEITAYLQQETRISGRTLNRYPAGGKADRCGEIDRIIIDPVSDEIVAGIRLRGGHCLLGDHRSRQT